MVKRRVLPNRRDAFTMIAKKFATRILYDDIIYCENGVVKNFVIVHCKNRDDESLKISLIKMFESLPPNLFYKIGSRWS